MTQSETTRLALVERDTKHIKEAVNRIETALINHVKWEENKYSNLEDKFASKSDVKEQKEDYKILEIKVDGNEKEIASIPTKMKKYFASLWVETAVKSIGVTVAGSLILALIYKVLA